MATGKRGARKSASNALPKEPSQAARDAANEAGTPLEPIGPGVEHEDHEGGLTDSLAKKGVRGAIEHEDDGSIARDENEPEGYRAPSVRERQTGMAAIPARGGMRGVRRRNLPDDASPAEIKAYEAGLAAAQGIEPGSKAIPVVATARGYYPAYNGRMRVEGEVFDYILGPKEEKLPSWVEDVSGTVESRKRGEPTVDLTPVTVHVQVSRTGGVSVINKG